MAPYVSSADHLFDELRRIDLLLRRAVLLFRAGRPENIPADAGAAVVYEQEVDALLDADDLLSRQWQAATRARGELAPIDKQLAARRKEIDARVAETARTGRTLRLAALQSMFFLSPADVDILLLAIAPELEPRYETIFGYLQNDATRTRPTVDLALNLLAGNREQKIGARASFSSAAPLLHFRLIGLEDDPGDRRPTLMRRYLKIDESVTQYLLEQLLTASTQTRIMVPARRIDDLACAAATRDELHNLVASLERDGLVGSVVHVTGAQPELASAAAEAVAEAMNHPLLLGELGALARDPDAALIWARDAALANAILGVTAWAQEGTDEQRPQASHEAALWRAVDPGAVPILLIGSDFATALIPANARIYPVRILSPEPDAQRELWQRALADHPNGFDVAQLAEAFPLPESGIQRIVSVARSYSALRNPSAPELTTDDLFRAGRSLNTPRLARYAMSIEPRYGWDDIILPPDRARQLRLLTARLRNRARVMLDWGFAAKMSRGKGWNALFVGPPGTGKTMAAEVIARELNLRLFQIDLPSVVSKYIGETERNLSVIFREAELTQSLLFFDEADALFGKRTEVKDAHDRYANQEVNYLLQRLEVYEGPVVLDHFQKNIDEAFLRRLHDVVEFPLPDVTDRRRIWAIHFPDRSRAAPSTSILSRSGSRCPAAASATPC